MFDPLLYSFLQFECIDDTTEPITEEAACRQPRSSNCMVFLKPWPFVMRNNVEITNAFMFQFRLMCCMNITLSGVIVLSFPTSNNFVQLVFAKIPGESARGPVWAPLVLFAFLAIAIYQNSTYWDSGLLISGNMFLLAGCSCALFLVCV